MNRRIILFTSLAALSVAGYTLRPSQPAPDATGPSVPTEVAAPAGSALVAVRTVPLSDNERFGETAFNAKCAVCHGTNAAGTDGKAPPLVHKIYEPGHHGDQSFLLAVRNGVRAHHWPFGNMPPVEGLTLSDVANIVAYVRALQRTNGIE